MRSGVSMSVIAASSATVTAMAWETCSPRHVGRRVGGRSGWGVDRRIGRQERSHPIRIRSGWQSRRDSDMRRLFVRNHK